jgi:hypothetical protein
VTSSSTQTGPFLPKASINVTERRHQQKSHALLSTRYVERRISLADVDILICSMDLSVVLLKQP